jgi:hypothetical protein
MRRVTALIGAMAVVLWATSAFAQAKPNFAGKWTIDTEKMAGAGGGGGKGGGKGGGAGETTITQDATTLVISRMQGGNEVKTTYDLTGKETTNQGRGGETKSTTKWDGAKLVITTTTPNGPQTTSWYMEGANLVNERQGQNGAMKTYYKKAS